MNVLSLFDGIACGRLALDRAEVPVTKYYASEIDKYAIQIAQKNYPDTIQLGNINDWESWDIEKPDLIIGGSPCQGFSFAGKQLAFDDPRSKLFFKFVEILNYYKPKYFLLENVRMKKEYLGIISQQLGVEPIAINSSLVSAQNRLRYYWCNWPVNQPEDKKNYLKDIIEHGVVDKDKSYCIDFNYWKGGNLTSYFEKHRRQLVSNHCDQNGFLDRKGHESNNRVYTDLGKSPNLVTHAGGGRHVKVLCTSERGRRLTPDGSKRDDKNGFIVRGYEVRQDGTTFALTTIQKDNYISEYVFSDKSQTILSSMYKENPKSMVKRNKKGLIVSSEDFVIRKLTPLECERLQTLPDKWTDGVSNTQRYKALGNAWTVDVVAHIFKGLKNE